MPAHMGRLAGAMLMALVLAIASLAIADTIHDGTLIEGQAIWFAGGNDHIVVGTVVVDEDASLTIQDGCVVRFDSGASLRVDGYLHASGTAGLGILMTSRDPGERWHGVRFTETGDGVLSHCTIEEAAQYTNSAGISASGTMPAIEHCTIRNNRYGITVFQADAPTLSVPNEIADNTVGGLYFYDCITPSVANQTVTGHVTAVGAIQMSDTGPFHIGPGNVVTGNSWCLTIDAGSFPDAASAGNITPAGNEHDDGFHVYAGSTARNVVWPDVGADYIVNGTPSIEVGGSLTIEDGVTVRFTSGQQLIIHGEILIDGSAGQGVLLTRRDEGGAWHALRMAPGSSGSIRHATIEYAAQYSNSAGILADGALPSVEHCTFRSNRHGVYVDEVLNPTLAVANTYVDNAVAGILFSACTNPSVSNQVLSDHTGSQGAIAMLSTGCFHIGPGNVTSGNSWGLTMNAGSFPDAASAGNIPVAGNINDDGFQVSGGSTTASVTWPDVGADYILTENVTIQGAGLLTIADGVTVKANTGIIVSIQGGILVEGTAAGGVLMTRRQPGVAWHGLRLPNGGTGTIRYCTIEHATQFSNSAGVHASGVLPAIEHCTLRNNRYGILATEVASPTLSIANTIADNTVAGIRFHRCTNPSVANQTVTGHGSDQGAIAMTECGSFHLGAGNVVTGNSWGLTMDAGSYPDAASAGNIPVAGNTNDDGMQVAGGSAAAAVTWPDVGASYVVTASPGFAGSSSLTIADGCTVLFGVGLHLTIHGHMQADGASDGILFTRRSDAGGWHGLRFEAGATAMLRRCDIEHANRFADSAGVHAAASSPALEDCRLRWNRNGLYVDEASPSLIRCTITENDDHGVFLAGASTPSFGNSLDQWNDIHDNAGGTLDRDLVNGTQDIAARYVYWGTTDAAEVEDRIHHEPDDGARGLVVYSPWTDATHADQYGAVDAPAEPDDVPRIFAFNGCAPNPFNPSTTIRYDLPEACTVRLVIHDLAGRAVATLVNERQSAGRKALRWDARGLASGAYFCRIEAGDFRRTRKVMVVR